MAQLRMNLFGAFRASLDEMPITKFRSMKNQALLAYLALEANRAHARSTLADLLWPEESQDAARTNLRQALFQLRSILQSKEGAEMEVLLISSTSVQFNPESRASIDVVHFLNLLDACERHEHADAAVCEACMHRLAQAADLYRGQLLDGFFVDQSPALEEWLLLRREDLHQRALSALYSLTNWRLAQGDASAAYRSAQRQIELDPLREEAYRQAMRALALSGEVSAAVALYLTCSQRLYDDLGVAPSAETEALFQQLSTGSLPTVEARPIARPRHNLPAPPTPFVGREPEVARVVERLLDPQCRQLTLIGIGGVGKTRLSLQAAANLMGAFADGVWFVPLAGVQMMADLATAIITALGLTPPKGDATRFLVDYLAGRELLLVLDNFEHLIPAADLLAEILTRGPQIKALVTSRERLNLQAEAVFVVDPLPIPSLTDEDGKVDLRAFSSVKLFAERASRSLLGFTLDDETLPGVAAICRLVNGLPLGIELAASWVDQFTCAEIAEAIGRNQDFLTTTQQDVPPRQRSLRAVFDHSWQLLAPSEQAALAKAAVFPSAFSRNAALAVAETEIATLAALTHKSLLRLLSPGRYAMHEVVRQFAGEELQARFDMGAGQRRHSQYYLEFVAGWEGMLWGDENSRAYSQILLEIDNVRAAWRWAAQHEMPDELRATLKALPRFYVVAGLYREAVSLLQLALDQLPTQADPAILALRSQLHNEAARLLHHLSDYPASAAAAEEALALADHLADTRLRASALRSLADALYQQGERPRAQEMMADALRLAQASGSAELEADCQLGYGDMLMYRGDPQVDDAHQAALTLYRQLGDRCGEAWTLNSMGIAAAFQKRYADSQGFFAAAVEIFRLLGDRPSTGRALNNLAAIYVLQKEYGQSEPILMQSLTLSRQNGYRLGEVQTLTNLTEALRGQGKRAEARRYCEDALTLSRTLGHVRGEGIQLKILGEMAMEDGDHAAAIPLFEQALTAARTQGDRYYEGERLYALGQAWAGLGDQRRAADLFNEARAVAQQVKDTATTARTTEALVQILSERWRKLTERLGLPEDANTGAEILRAYTAEGRAYHDLAHLVACLHWLDDVRDLAERADEIELALWFHDAVYDPRHTDNEAESAAWAQRWLHESKIDEAQIERVTALVLVTDHRRTPCSEDERWIVDIDLAILGSAAEVYARYEQAIRQEYEWVEVSVYRTKRGEVLRSFLDRDRIYVTNYFQQRLEGQARQNLEWAINRLPEVI